MKGVLVAATVCLSLAAPKFAAAIDVWDQTSGHLDDNAGTDNELAPGSEQIHDLQAVGGIADEDWYLLGQQPYSSYEVVVDGLTEQVASIPATQTADPVQLDLVDSAGSALNTGYAFSSIGSARNLRIRNNSATEIINQYVRVRTGTDGCTTACTVNAQYRIHLFETTYLIPRFNNSGTQVTILIVQNGSDESVGASAHFWSPTGTLLGSQSMTLSAHGTAVINTAGVPGVAGQGGSITLDNDGHFGALHGKAVALEPSTGFTFDTMMSPKFQ